VSEVILPLPATVHPPRNVRSTLLLSSVAEVTGRGYAEPYFAALPREYHDIIRSTLAGVWLPFDVAIAHYKACDALGLSPDAQTQLGRAVEVRTRATLLGTAVRMAKGVGVTPWSVLPQLQRFWDRGFDGGGIVVTKSGPKDALVDIVRFPLNDIPYFRNSLRGMCSGILDLFCSKSWTLHRPGTRAPGSVSFHVQWA
jgi:hypothetical protein